ncbi:hypothetical protein Taro_049615 [Colocasia esculenta]|uniref:Exostosin GT47 domain-containing protein n=2 Tax=Magnoliopsida TaxID=3398 RepID=A0A843XBN9_COLES|nr:hypothetical protein [Colocasia esculenta]
MAGGGKQHGASSSSSVFPFRTPRAVSSTSTATLLAVFFSIAMSSLIFLFFFSSTSSSSRCSPDLNRGNHLDARFSDPANPRPKFPTDSPPEYSFVVSLENFLASRPSTSQVVPDLTGEDGGDAAVEALDGAVSSREADELFGGGASGPWSALSVVRVYVYEMPAKFTYDLLRLFHDTYKETVNLTSNGSPVHRLIEQHSVDYWLWADLISPESKRLLKNVIRVHRQEEADLFYIPFFTTISYFLLEKQQCKTLYREALKWLTGQPAWQRSGGRDHILPVHHPWSFKSVRRLMKKAIWLLPDMDSTGNWYKPGQVWLEKDLILPYVPNVEFCDEKCLLESQSQRNILLFFRGRLKRNAGGKIRSKLGSELHGVDGVIIEEGSTGEAGKIAAQNGMRKSIFCLCPAGDTPSSARLFDAIVSACIPVVVSDELELPFEGILDYRKIALFVSSSDAVKPGWLIKFLKSIDSGRIREMQLNLSKYSRHFRYSSPSQPLGPEDLTWRMIAGKLVNIKLHIRRSQRVVQESRSLCTCDCRRANLTTPLPLNPFILIRRHSSQRRRGQETRESRRGLIKFGSCSAGERSCRAFGGIDVIMRPAGLLRCGGNGSLSEEGGRRGARRVPRLGDGMQGEGGDVDKGRATRRRN